MGNPKFFFFPEPDGSQLVEIDLGEGLAEFFFDFEVQSSTGVAFDGAMYRSTTTHRQVLNIQRDRFTAGEDLAIKFAALQNHLDRGFSCAFAVDSDRAWCHPIITEPAGGDQSVLLGGDPFRGFSGLQAPLANDYCSILSQNPELLFEQNKVSNSFSSVGWSPAAGGTLPLTNKIAFSYSKPSFITHYRFFPLLKRIQGDVGTNIITNETGRLFSLSIRLVVDTASLFSFHPDVDQQAGQANSWIGAPVQGGVAAGRVTLDRPSSTPRPTGMYNPRNQITKPWWS